MDNIYSFFAMEAIANRQIEEDADNETGEVTITVDTRIDNFEKSYTIRDKYWPLVTKKLPIAERKLFAAIAKYHDAHYDVLETPYYTKFPSWDKIADEKIIFDTIGVTAAEVTRDFQQIKNPEFYKIKKFNLTAVHIIMLLFIRYYWETKQPKKAELIYYYFGYSMYWMAWTRSFSVYNPPEPLVVYTVNNLSKQYILKQCGSINKLIYHGVNVPLLRLDYRLIDGADYLLVSIADSIRTTIGGYLRKLAGKTIENMKDKQKIWKGKSVDSLGNEITPTSQLANTSLLADQKATAFFANPVREDLITDVSSANHINKREVHNVISQLSLNHEFYDEVHEFYECIFNIYLSIPTATVRSIKSIYFAVEMQKIYKKGNTKNPMIVRLREILNHWLEVASQLYRNASRLAMKNDYRRAIFYYFIFEIANNQ